MNRYRIVGHNDFSDDGAPRYISSVLEFPNPIHTSDSILLEDKYIGDVDKIFHNPESGFSDVEVTLNEDLFKDNCKRLKELEHLLVPLNESEIRKYDFMGKAD